MKGSGEARGPDMSTLPPPVQLLHFARSGTDKDLKTFERISMADEMHDVDGAREHIDMTVKECCGPNCIGARL